MLNGTECGFRGSSGRAVRVGPVSWGAVGRRPGMLPAGSVGPGGTVDAFRCGTIDVGPGGTVAVVRSGPARHQRRGRARAQSSRVW